MLHSPTPETPLVSTPPCPPAPSASYPDDDFEMTFVIRKGNATYSFILGGDEPIMIIAPDSFTTGSTL